jgi:hypothetical protein
MLPIRPQISPASDEYDVFSGVRENPSEIAIHSTYADYSDAHDSSQDTNERARLMPAQTRVKGGLCLIATLPSFLANVRVD